MTIAHHHAGLKRDAASVWLEDITTSSCKICLRELQNYAGSHEDIYVVSEVFSWGARDGAVVGALASHQFGPGSNLGVDAIRGLSLLLVHSFAPRGFSPGTPVFPSPQKPTFPNSNSTRNKVDKKPLCGCATSKSLFIYLFIYLMSLNYQSNLFNLKLNNYVTHNKRCYSRRVTIQ